MVTRRTASFYLWLYGEEFRSNGVNLGWALFLDGVAGFYAVIATVSNSLGMKIPFGKPFVQP